MRIRLAGCGRSVSDLVRKRLIWSGGEDRSEATMVQRYAWLGPRRSPGIRLAVLEEVPTEGDGTIFSRMRLV